MNRFHRRNLAAAALIVFLVLSVSPAQADVAPPRPPAGSNLEAPTVETNVRMVSEMVYIDIPSYSPYSTGHAVVTAVFKMRNTGDVQEEMQVRFPMCWAYSYYGTEMDPQGYYYYPAIDHFSVTVDGAQTPVTQTNETLQNMLDSTSENIENIEVPCWANFPVSFPAKQDVEIKVSYQQPGGYTESRYRNNLVEFSYVLFTGEGWKDTIGSADIIVNLPVEVEELYQGTQDREPDHLSGKQIRWHFEDFEPVDDLRRVSFTIIQPSYWIAIQQERENTLARPNDGEAWGRLGKAIKEAIVIEWGFADGDLYEESAGAYQRAVELLPNDADWHFGYADLVCREVEFQLNFVEPAVIAEEIKVCIDQLDATFALSPGHEEASSFIEYFSYAHLKKFLAQRSQAAVSPTGTAVYRPTLTSRPSPLATNTITPVIDPAGILATKPRSSPIATETPARVDDPVNTPTITPAVPSKSKVEVCGTPLLPAIAAAVLVLRRRR